MAVTGPGAWCQLIQAGMTLDEAKQLEVETIGRLHAEGAPLVNRNLLSRYGVVNRHPVGTEEYRAAGLEYRRRRYETPEGKTLALAASALWWIRQGGSLTPTRERQLKAAGWHYLPAALEVVSARQRNGRIP